MNNNDPAAFIVKNAALQLGLLKALCAIPAPSGREHARAAFIQKTLSDWGIPGAFTDEAFNVILPVGDCSGSELSVIAAHTDTVFPDCTPFTVTEDEEKLYCPGIGDDTVCVVQLMLAAKYLFENGIRPAKGLLLVFNAGEEGLGNLKGTRSLFKAYKGRIARFLSFDHHVPGEMVTRCVGSERFRVTVETAGGHSYTAFGNENAAARLAEIITALYRTEIPAEWPGKTTYNVGTISGGTSVNTIAQSAEMLAEYRSDEHSCLGRMRERFLSVFRKAERPGVKVTVETVGSRPCAKDTDPEKQRRLECACAGVLKAWTGKAPVCVSGSTDCNIPASLGIPAVCVPVYRGGRSHTREEWISKDSLLPGLGAALRFALMMTE